ncbi:MAG TPA: AAA family ATPase [Bacteroidales bacterium]|nr:AAA family ATPase [Bacteroidales bacterium]
MEDALKYYLENTIVKKAAIESRLTHPITKLRYPARLVFSDLKKYTDDFLKSGSEPRFISLSGLRGVGKTTLLWQTANYIYSKYQKEIYFFNVNILKNLGVDLYSALEAFQQHIIKKRFNELSEPITLFFDEVHDDENWSQTLKILYDEARTAFILCSGSSALLLNQTADLARRMRVERIFPFKFTEFVAAKTYLERQGKMVYPDESVAGELYESIFYSETAQEAISRIISISEKVQDYFQLTEAGNSLRPHDLWQGYVRYQNIPGFLFFKEKYTVNDSIRDLFKRVILEDIPKLKPDYTDYTKIERLILRLAGSDEINPEKLAGLVGVKQNEINEMIDILSKAELITVLSPYGGLDSRIFKNKKAFFMSPSLRSALLSTLYGINLPTQFESKLIEDTIVMYLRIILKDAIISFSSRVNESNPDFVIETRDKPIILETGTGKTSARQIAASFIDSRYGVLVSQGITKPSLKDNCIRLPLNWFLLL